MPKHLKEPGRKMNVVYTVDCSALDGMEILVQPGKWRRLEHRAKWNEPARTHAVTRLHEELGGVTTTETGVPQCLPDAGEGKAED